jgi:hypothetical protein
MPSHKPLNIMLQHFDKDLVTRRWTSKLVGWKKGFEVKRTSPHNKRLIYINSSMPLFEDNSFKIEIQL